VTAPVQSPRILIVDDDEGMLILMADMLRVEGYDVTAVDSGRAALAWLGEHTPDLMLLDLKMKDVDGPALVEKMRRGEAPVPFVVVTGQGDEKVAVKVMKQGALDYVIKDTGLLDLLPAVVKRALFALAQEKALVAAQAEHKRLEGEVLAASERERHSIGADLHDGLGQQLTAIELMCAALKEDVPATLPDIAKRLEQLGGMLRESVALTRFLARGLVPVADDPDGLQMGLAELAGRTHALGRVSCRFESPELVAVSDRAVAGQLFRLAQEAMNNAIKHARASRIVIRLMKKNGSLVLEVADDGIGLPKDREAGAGGLGLGVMRHRARVIGAELAIKSKRGEGVTVTCTLPFKP
jgi:signal transduction histidine kinase